METNYLQRKIFKIESKIKRIKELQVRISQFHVTCKGTPIDISYNLQKLYDHGCRNARSQLSRNDYKLFRSFSKRYSVVSERFEILSADSITLDEKLAQIIPTPLLQILPNTKLNQVNRSLNTFLVDLDQILIEYKIITQVNNNIINQMSRWIERLIQTTVFHNENQ